MRPSLRPVLVCDCPRTDYAMDKSPANETCRISGSPRRLTESRQRGSAVVAGRKTRVSAVHLYKPAVPPSPLRDRVGYSNHVRFRGYFPVHFIPAYNLPVYASQWEVKRARVQIFLLYQYFTWYSWVEREPPTSSVPGSPARPPRRGFAPRLAAPTNKGVAGTLFWPAQGESLARP